MKNKQYRMKIMSIARLERFSERSNDWFSIDELGINDTITSDAIKDRNVEVIDALSHTHIDRLTAEAIKRWYKELMASE